MKTQNSTKRRLPIYWIAGGILILIATIILMLLQFSEPATVDPIRSAVSSPAVTSNLTATGKVQSTERATLAFEMPGKVLSVSVNMGDAVIAGEILAKLDTTELEINLEIAQQNLIIQKAHLAEMLKGATEAELAAAQTAVVSAAANLARLENGPRPAEIALQLAEQQVYTANTSVASASLQAVTQRYTADQIAATRVEVAQAEAALIDARKINSDWQDEQTHRLLQDAEEQVAIAQSRLNDLLEGPNTYERGSAEAEVASAIAQEEAVQLQNDIFLQGGTPEQIAAAQAQLAHAQATFDTLERGATSEQLRVAETAVSQAQLAVTTAEVALDKAIIRAPFNGIIKAVYIAEGEFASGPAIELLNPNKLEVVLKVSEIDIAQIAEGQTAIVHTETWPMEKLESQITRISPSTIVGESRVNYEIRLALPESQHPIRVGMTAIAELITK